MRRRVLSFVGICGLMLWSPSTSAAQITTINGTANLDDAAYAVALDANGDVIAAGTTRNAATRADFTVVKVSGADGAELWRTSIHGTLCYPSVCTPPEDDTARAVAVDAYGDVIAAGTINGFGIARGEFFVVKLSGETGTEVWRTSFSRSIPTSEDAGSHATAIAVDAYGDVVATGLSGVAGILIPSRL